MDVETDLSSVERQPRSSGMKRWQIIALIVLLAAAVRVWSAWQLPLDVDEPTYMKSGEDYARLIQAGDWQGFLQYDTNLEHPALVKLLYSTPFLIFQPQFGSTTEFFFNRGISVLFGVLAVFILSLLSPLAGFFLALDSMVIKYTSEVYLEALPLFAMLLAVWAFKQVAEGKASRKWLWLAAVALGAAVAGKYLYGVAIIPLISLAIERRYFHWKETLGFALVAGLSFLVFNPAIWIDPVGRLTESLRFHLAYTQSYAVLRADYPWYQPFIWITNSVPWHPQVFFYPTADLVVAILAVPGILVTFRRDKWMTIWAVLTLGILLVWGTKWPQYTLILIPALCLLAAEGLHFLIRVFRNLESYWNWAEAVLFHPGKSFWVALIVFITILLAGKIYYEVDMAIARRGWTSVGMDYSPLPSNTINDLTRTRDGKMLLATNQGLAVWKPEGGAFWGEEPQVFNMENSDLPSPVVTAVIEAQNGDWWLGTDKGVAFFRQGNWQTFPQEELAGLTGSIQDIAEDGAGRIWIATLRGAAMYSDDGWTDYTVANSGLTSEAIYSVTVQMVGYHEIIWFGTLGGVSRFDISTGEWMSIDLAQNAIGFGGVVDLMVDAEERLWVATSGGGISIYDGVEWRNYRVGNSRIPQNSVTGLIEDEPGIFWLGFAYATEPGGLVARFDGNQWQTYTSSNSGFTGYEPAALALDPFDRLWIGLRQGGLVIYQINQ